jgi:polyisoprenoid-binding protein YceI
MRPLIFCVLATVLFSPATRAQVSVGVPVFEVTPVHSSIKFAVKASISIVGKFDKWDAALTFQSPDVATGVLEITIQADSVDTGSGMKRQVERQRVFRRGPQSDDRIPLNEIRADEPQHD